MKSDPIILHIDLKNQSVYSWLKQNKYTIFSELIRYSKKLLEEKLDYIQAILISNYSNYFKYHALGLLYQIKKNDKLAITKLVAKFSKSSLKSPYAYCFLVSFSFKFSFFKCNI